MLNLIRALGDLPDPADADALRAGRDRVWDAYPDLANLLGCIYQC
ncbi:hypothetical protein [Mariniluteicoccus flavus]